MRPLVRNLRAVSEPSEPTGAPRNADPGVLHVARQPLFDRDEQTAGARLLCVRGSGSPGGFLAAMPGGADAEMVLADEMHSLAPRGQVLLSVSPEELVSLRAISLPPERFLLAPRLSEPLSEEMGEALDRHAMRGFRLAIDSADLAASTGPLAERAKAIVFDTAGSSPDRLAVDVNALRNRMGSIELVATGVNTRAAFENCRRLGFDLMQGQFFLKPTSRLTGGAAEAGLGGLGTMAELTITEDFEQLAAIITRDPGLSMRLLRYANSAHMALPRRVGSVHEALAWMGTVAVREFALVAAVANVPEAPPQMLTTALTRARICQQLARQVAGTNPEESFTVGLFSVAEAIANAPLEVLVGELPLREDIASALIVGVGELGRLLNVAVAYERGEFDAAANLGLGAGVVAEAYLDAVRWADSAVKAVS